MSGVSPRQLRFVKIARFFSFPSPSGEPIASNTPANRALSERRCVARFEVGVKAQGERMDREGGPEGAESGEERAMRATDTANEARG